MYKYLLFFSINLFCCNVPTKYKKQNIPDKDIQAIVKRSILGSLPNGSLARYGYKLLPPIPSNKFSHYNDSIKKILDTTDVYIVINDTLKAPSIYDIQELNALINAYKDSSFFEKELIQTLIKKTDSSLQVVLIDSLKKLPFSIKTKQSDPREEYRSIGYFNLSNIVYNNSKDKAAIYIQLYYGHRYGRGQVIILEKINGIWEIKNNYNIWIS